MPVVSPPLRSGPYRPTAEGEDHVGLLEHAMPRMLEDHAVLIERPSNAVSYLQLAPPAVPGEGPSRSETVLRGHVAALLSTQTPAVLAAVVDALADFEASPTLDEELWGTPPSAVDYLRAAARSATRIAMQEEALLDRGQTVEETAKRLGIDSGVVIDRMGQGEFVAFERDGVTVLPNWQFTDDGSAVLPGISEVRRSFPGGVLALSAWMVASNDRLDGRTPRAFLVAGDTEQVAAVAQVIGS